MYSITEKSYCTNLNNKIELLGESVPALQTIEEKDIDSEMRMVQALYNSRTTTKLDKV